MSLANDAVKGINAVPESVFCLPPDCPPWTETYLGLTEIDYPDAVRQYVEQQVLQIRMREDQAAFLLFGVHA